jgi:putative transposase
MARRCRCQVQCSSIVAEQLGRELLSAQMDGGPSLSMGLRSQISRRPTGSRCRSSDAKRRCIDMISPSTRGALRRSRFGHSLQIDCNTLEQAVFTRRRTDFRFTTTGLVHHSDAGSQYTLLAFTDALPDSGIAGSIGSVGDALDNALMESAIGLYKTELIDRQKSWTGRAEVERETASWVHWYNTTRLHSSLGYLSPVDYENRYRQTVTSTPEVA